MEEKDLAAALQDALKKLAASTPTSKGGRDGGRIVPLLSQIERNTRLIGGRSPAESGAAAGRGKGSQQPDASPSPARQKAATATAKAAQQTNSATSRVESKALTQAVAKGAAAGVASAMADGVAAQQRVAEKTVKATSAAQAKANADFLQRQKKLATGPKSAAALKERRANPQGPDGQGKSGWLKGLLSAGGRGAMQAGAVVKKSDGAKDAIGEMTVGGPIWGAIKEVAEAASEAGESLQDFRKKTDKTTKATEKSKKGPASRVRGGRYEARKEQREERRQNALLQAIKRIRPGGGGAAAAGEGGGLLSSMDDAMDIWGHAKDSKWGKRARGTIGKGAKFGKGLIGKGLGLVGLGGAGVAGATGLAGAGAGGAAAAGVGGKVAGKLGARAIPVIGQALAVGMAAYDGFQGWTDKNLHAKSFGTKAGEEATTGQKAAAATANVLDMGGLTSMALGLVGVETDASKFARGIYDSLNDLTKSVDKNSKTEKENTSWLAQLVSPDSWLGKMMGMKGAKPKNAETLNPSVMTGAQVAVEAKAATTPAPTNSILPVNKTTAMREGLGLNTGAPSADPLLGSLSAKYESGGKSDTVAYDQRGGTSYGKYQIASQPGTMNEFLKHLDTASPEAAQRLRAAGQLNTGSATGAAPDEWKKLVSEGKLTDEMQHDFIKKTHYDKAFKQLSPEAQAKVNSSSTLKDSFWSRAVSSPGNAATDFNSAIAEQKTKGFDDSALLDNVYDKRLSRAQSSPDSLKGLTNRFGNGPMSERAEAKRRLAQEGSGKDATKGAAMVGLGSDALDSTTLNMPVKTAQGIKTPAQMGITTNSELQSKGGQAFAGGHNDPATTFLTAQIMKETQATSLAAQNDTYHQKNAKTSGHTQGVKTDFSYAGLSDAGYKQKHAEISSMLANKHGMKEGEDFNILSDPHGTGRHIDFKLNPSGQKKAEAARQAALAREQGVSQAAKAEATNPAMGESFRRQAAQVSASRPKDPESAADIKAKTPPPPVADNRGVEQRLDAMTKQQVLGQQKAERDTESQNMPNIPFEFDDYTLQLWSNDRA